MIDADAVAEVEAVTLTANVWKRSTESSDTETVATAFEDGAVSTPAIPTESVTEPNRLAVEAEPWVPTSKAIWPSGA